MIKKITLENVDESVFLPFVKLAVSDTGVYTRDITWQSLIDKNPEMDLTTMDGSLRFERQFEDVVQLNTDYGLAQIPVVKIRGLWHETNTNQFLLWITEQYVRLWPNLQE